MTTVQARIAIITRTKDRPLFLRRCAQSVLAQTCGDWVHVVVNDGGDPALVEAEFAPWRACYRGRLHVIHNPCSLGMEAASNVGIRHCDSELIVIHDDDDTWRPNFLTASLARMQAARFPVAGCVCHAVQVHERVGKGQIRITGTRPFNRWLREITLHEVFAPVSWVPICFLFSRAAAVEVGLFDERFAVFGDLDFNLRFLARYDIALLPQVQAQYHLRSQRSGGPEDNSLMDRTGQFSDASAFIKNKYLREDLAQGRAGLGLLINTLAPLSRIHFDTRISGEVWRRLTGSRPARWLIRAWCGNGGDGA